MARYPRRHPRPRSPDLSLNQSLIGSPRDEIPRKQLVESDIDVHKSYEGEVEQRVNGELDEEVDEVVDEEVERIQSPAGRRPSWEPWGRPEPLVDPSQLPRNWTMRDDDIDPEFVQCRPFSMGYLLTPGVGTSMPSSPGVMRESMTTSCRIFGSNDLRNTLSRKNTACELLT